MAEISVVVPVYKVKKYLHKCLESIQNQTFADLEIILVDDGCPDGCGDICDEFAAADRRIKVIHKENGGLSDARNEGAKQATSEYIIFIDSDDYIELDMLEYLYTNITETKADIATCGVFDVYAGKIQTPDEAAEIFVCGAEEFYAYILRGTKIRGEIWNKLMRRELLRTLEFPKGKLYEDIYFTADLAPLLKRVCVGTMPKYYYLHREGSITGKPYRKQLLDIIEGYEKTYKVVCQHFPALESEAECLKIWSRFIVLDKILLAENYQQIEELSVMVDYLRQHRSRIMHNPYFNARRKLAILILSISVGIYRQTVLAAVRRQEKLEE